MNSKRMVGIAMLAAIVAVLQTVATFFPLKPNISLTLIPIVIGAAVYGKKCGALLGLVFGIVTLLDPTAAGFMALNPVATVVMLLLKGTAAGWVSGLVFELLSKNGKNIYFAGVSAAVICPIVNTAIFCLGMLTVFNDTLNQMANGANLVYFMIFGLIGVNFLIELGLNLILSPAIIRIITAGKKGA